MFANIDFLSPPITLFHLGKRTHTSRIGATLFIILLIICFSFATFLIYNLVSHKQMTYIFHKKFEYEAGYYSFNSSSVFHFIQIFAPDNGGYFDKFDSRYIRAYTTYAKSNLTYDNLHLFDHWVFAQCRNNVDDEGLDPSLFTNVENFTNGVCIRYFYNSKERKYYSFGADGFKWPYLEHGMAQRNNIYLTTIIQKCSNDSVINEIFGQCPSQKEIDDYLSKYFGIYLYFTDTQIDPTNFKKPVTQFLQVVSTGIGTSQAYVECHIHFSPVRILTKIGSIFGKSSEMNSFYFDFNRKGSASNDGQKYFTLTRYYHLMQNNVQIYERRYNNFFDILSEIGGIAQFIFYFFYWINYVYNLFIVDADTNSMFFSLDQNELGQRRNTHFSLNPIFNNIKSNENDNKIYSIQNNILNLNNNKDNKIRKSAFYLNSNNKKENSNSFQSCDAIVKTNSSGQFKNKRINSSEIDNFDKNNMKKEKNITAYKINDDNSKEIIYSINIKKNLELTPNSKKSKTINNKSVNGPQKSLNNKKSGYKLLSIKNPKDIINKVSISKVSINNLDYDNAKPIKKLRHVSSIIDFTKSVIFKKEKTNYHYIHLFRKHLLSEEHLLKSHITIVLLEKKCKINDDETTNFFECYDKL